MADKVEGKSKAGTRARPERAWTKRQQVIFFDHLAATCNVRAATKAAGTSTSSIYRRRLKDAAFAARWEEALDMGMTRLEALMLERALGNAGADEDTIDPERAQAPFDMKMAASVLASRDARLRRSVRTQRACMPIDQLEKLLLRRLGAVEKRLGEKLPGRAA